MGAHVQCLFFFSPFWQDIFNLLPNLNATELTSAMSSTTSDQMLVVYLATLLRATVALHSLINNKVSGAGFLLRNSFHLKGAPPKKHIYSSLKITRQSVRLKVTTRRRAKKQTRTKRKTRTKRRTRTSPKPPTASQTM